MPYHVEIDERLVLDYLEGTDLNIEDLDKLLDFLDGPEGLSIVPDAYRNDPANRAGHGTSRFEIRHLFEDSAGRYRLFRFVVDDTHAATYGVLRVVYVDEL